MKKNSYFSLNGIIVFATIALVSSLLVMHEQLIVGVLLVTILVVTGVFYTWRIKKKLKLMTQHTCEEIDTDKLVEDVIRDMLDCMPHPAAVANVNGDLIISNRYMEEWLGRPLMENEHIYNIWPGLTWNVFKHGVDHDTIEHLDRWYKVIYHQLDCERWAGDKMMLLYLIDITDSKFMQERIVDVKPVIMMVKIDNCADVFHGIDDGNKSSLLSEVYKQLNEYIMSLDGVYKRLSEDDAIAILDRKALIALINDKFDVLDKIRTIKVTEDISLSVSIGVAAGEMPLYELAKKAQAGLDLALGRGGDQAVVYYENKTEFFGGKAKPVEKNTQVKARIVAQAIKRAILESDNVFIMGHIKEDFDSLGAAIGVSRMVKLMGKKAFIIISQPGLAINKISNIMVEYRNEYDNMLISPEQAEKNITSQDVIFVVDVHKPLLTAAPTILHSDASVIVIDHHRRAEDFIENPMLVYLEPSASSTSELVTEIIQYFDDRIDLTRLEASMLFAGIVLDTKNFSMQVGVRTFEAAAALRRRGADPALVRNLMRIDKDTFQDRATIVSNVESLPGGIVMAICPKILKNSQVVASQAADMLLSIDGVRVSFVIFRIAEDEVGISARSQGDVNVQVIMEKLGGGGHQTVAGAQIKHETIATVSNKLKNILLENESI